MINFPIPILQRKPRRKHGFWYYVMIDLVAGAFGLLLLWCLAYVILT